MTPPASGIVSYHSVGRAVDLALDESDADPELYDAVGGLVQDLLRRARGRACPPGARLYARIDEICAHAKRAVDILAHGEQRELPLGDVP